jgi:hypothetical protein
MSLANLLLVICITIILSLTVAITLIKLGLKQRAFPPDCPF